jgi:hypothetical protein
MLFRETRKGDQKLSNGIAFGKAGQDGFQRNTGTGENRLSADDVIVS